MGTAREIVSRHLKQFESNGWVQLNRGRIDIKNPNALTNICEEQTIISVPVSKKDQFLRHSLLFQIIDTLQRLLAKHGSSNQ